MRAKRGNSQRNESAFCISVLFNFIFPYWFLRRRKLLTWLYLLPAICFNVNFVRFFFCSAFLCVLHRNAYCFMGIGLFIICENCKWAAARQFIPTHPDSFAIITNPHTQTHTYFLILCLPLSSHHRASRAYVAVTEWSLPNHPTSAARVSWWWWRWNENKKKSAHTHTVDEHECALTTQAWYVSEA